MVSLVNVLRDLVSGLGSDTSEAIEGRALVFGRGDATGRGFLRATPLETGVMLSFPAGHLVFDPEKRAKGLRGAETRLSLATTHDLDPYVRRMISAAYALEAPSYDEFFR
ncbi:MAG: hypothetical protein H6729_05110 [Deltaproteobacteria bacterium]|nr:hypothetical protein [Deltaproteobacteria bacterium]